MNSIKNLCAGRVEFTSFLPQNTQAAIIQPIGSEGVLIAASNTQRGFTRLDQVPVMSLMLSAFSTCMLNMTRSMYQHVTSSVPAAISLSAC